MVLLWPAANSATANKVLATAPPSPEPPEASPEGSLLRPARAAFEARHIARVLREQGGNVSRAADALGLSRAQLQKKIKEYGLREGTV